MKPDQYVKNLLKEYNFVIGKEIRIPMSQTIELGNQERSRQTITMNLSN